MAKLVLEVDNDKFTNFVDLLEATVAAAKVLPEYVDAPKTAAQTKGGKTYPKKEWKEETISLPLTLEKAEGGNGASDAQCGAAYATLRGFGMAEKSAQHEAFKAVLAGDIPAHSYDLSNYSKGSVSKLISALKQNEALVKGVVA